MKTSELTACPHCGCESYYRRVRFSGVGVYRYRFDGERADNTELHSGLGYVEAKTMYCEECEKPLGSAPTAQTPQAAPANPAGTQIDP
jgi:hypothetical protein